MERPENKKRYIVSGPLAGDVCIIHRDGCPVASISPGRNMDAEFDSPEEAAGKTPASGITVFCPFCLKEKKLASPAAYFSSRFSMLQEPPEAALLCGVN